MPNPEKQPERNISNVVTPTAMPARVEDGEHQVFIEKMAGSGLNVQVAHGEQLIFSASVTDKQDVTLVFSDGRQVLFPAQSREKVAETSLPSQEDQIRPEYPPITIEGYPVRAGKYTRNEKTGKSTYTLTLAHHPDPKDRKAVVYYELVAEDEKAKECFQAGVIDTRTPVHITGDDYTFVSRKKDGSEKIVHRIHIESLEKIKEKRLDSPTILREKIRLSQSAEKDQPLG